jgi:hypothetical protein
MTIKDLEEKQNELKQYFLFLLERENYEKLKLLIGYTELKTSKEDFENRLKE